MRVRHAEIAGAGLAGLAAGIALRQRGWSVRVHERGRELRVAGSGLSIFENALRVLRALGAHDAAVAGARRGYLRETRDALGRTTSRTTYPVTMYEVTRAQLVRAMLDAAARIGVEVATGSTVASVSPDGAVELTDGKRLAADLVVVADGVRSRLRQALSLPARRRLLADGAIRIVIPRLPEEVTSPDGQMNIEYWSGRRRVLVAACSDTELYVALTTLESDAAGKSIPIEKPLWEAAFPALRQLIDRLDGEARWDRFEVVRLPRWSSGKAVVLGDAAHAMAPNLGQGGACAMMNALSLAVHLESATDVGEALRRWEAAERPLTDHTQRLSSYYSALTHWPGPLRSAAFGAVARLRFLREQHLRCATHVPTGT